LLPVAAAEIMCGGGGDVKTVVRLELDLPLDSSFAYQPGDSIGIFPPNSDDDVQLLLQRCRSVCCSQFELPPVPPAASRGNINSETFLKWGVDLRACVTKKVMTRTPCLSIPRRWRCNVALPLPRLLAGPSFDPHFGRFCGSCRAGVTTRVMLSVFCRCIGAV
jgi:hypothetical protein